MLTLIDAQNPEKSFNFEISLESVHCLKEIEGRVCCGGSFGSVEILVGGVSWITLYRAQALA